MTSTLEVWNLALSHLGDKAGLSSVTAPYTSREAQLCAMYWPTARRSALQKFKPSFATQRAALSELDLGAAQPDQWLFAYTTPSTSIHILGVYDPNRTYDQDDTGEAREMSGNDAVIYTNVENAIVRYVEDTETSGRFSPMFALGVSYFLAALVAGPLIKGKDGRALASDLMKTAMAFHASDAADDANQSELRGAYSDNQMRPPWIAARDFRPDNGDARIIRDED